MIQQALYTVEEVSAMILEGKKLLLAGDDKLLSQLPKGDWIGGTTPYFILYPEQRIESSKKLFVCCLPDFIEKIEIREYDSSGIKNIYSDAPQNGFTVLIIPIKSPVHSEYSMNVPDYKDFARYPVCGWISIQHANYQGVKQAYACSGLSGILYSDKAVAMHISLPENKYAEMHMINPLEQGGGDVITFNCRGRFVKEVMINGLKQNFAEYLRKLNLDNQVDFCNVPLVANYSGAMANTHCMRILEDDIVELFSSVFEQIEYRFAQKRTSFAKPDITHEEVVFSVTCGTHFVWPETLDSKFTEVVNGPAAGGEIAYQLFGQSIVYITIGDVTQDWKKTIVNC